MIPTDRLVSVTMTGSPVTRVEPVTLAEAMQQLNIALSLGDDAVIAQAIAAARAWFEEYTGRQTITAIYDYRCVPQGPVIDLPRPPLQAVLDVIVRDGSTESVLDTSEYRVVPSAETVGSPGVALFDPFCPPGQVEILSGTWPTGEIRVRRRCGYGDSADTMPGLVKSTLLFLIGHLYRNRAEVTGENVQQIPMGAEMLIRGFKYAALRVAG